jgi:hypothetical protein
LSQTGFFLSQTGFFLSTTEAAVFKKILVFTQALKHYMFVAIARSGDLKRWEIFY